jgi:hypothetical protein
MGKDKLHIGISNLEYRKQFLYHKRINTSFYHVPASVVFVQALESSLEEKQCVSGEPNPNCI